MRLKSSRLAPAKGRPRPRRGGDKPRRLGIEALEDRRLLSVIPLGDEFRVNQFISGVQQTWPGSQAAAVNASGDFFVAYSGKGPGDSSGVFGRRFSASASPLADSFRLNTTTSGNQQFPSVAIGPSGEIVAVWSGKGPGDPSGVFLRRFTFSNGFPLGGETRVNATVQGTQTKPVIATLTNGQYVVAWSGKGPGDATGVFARRIDAQGNPLGNHEVLVNRTVAQTQQQPSVAPLPGGGFVVTWSGTGVGDRDGVFYRRYDANGVALADEALVNTTMADLQQFPDVATDAAGRIVVVWSGAGVGDSSGVFQRRFLSNGTPLDLVETRVNTTTAETQTHPSVAATPDGSTLVVWESRIRAPRLLSRWSVVGRGFDPAGQPLDNEVLIPTTFTGSQLSPAVATNALGESVVAWSGKGTGDMSGVFARRFAIEFDITPPEVTAALIRDTGQSPSDGLTADAGIAGQVTDQSRIASLKVALDQSALQDVTVLVGLDGRFTLDHTRLQTLFPDALVDGQHQLRLQATDEQGNVSSSFDVFFTLDASAPQVAAGLTEDTGKSATDGVTQTVEIAGRLSDASGIASFRAGFDAAPLDSFFDVSGTLGLGRDFTLDRPRLEPIFGGPIPDGPHTLHLVAADEHGNVSSFFDVFFTLDTTPPAGPTFDLSPTSNSGLPGGHQTAFARVTLIGQTDSTVPVLLTGTGSLALSSNRGGFQFTNVALAPGDNVFTARATDAAGNTSEQQVTIQRVGQAAGEDAVLRWNRMALEAIRLDGANPPVASRGLGMLHAAIYDAVSAIDGTPGYYVAIPAPNGASAEAAVAGAAHRVLEYLFPAQQAMLDATLADALAVVPAGDSRTDGLNLGHSVADAIIALRSGDGWDAFVAHVAAEPGLGEAGQLAGVWQPTAPMFAEALVPQWATLEPFAMTSPDQFRPDGPPPLEGLEYAAAFNEVKALGRATGSTRTDEQTEIARFWADGAGTYTPPGHWNQISEAIALAQGNSLAENARLFAELNIALADAAIACWDVKYHDNFWRPVTAINRADTDGNPDTSPDSAWTSLLITPPFPEYISGHSTFSAAAASLLAANFGDNLSFDTTSIGLPGVTRSFASFDAAAKEAGESRVYGGIHFQFSNLDGQATGRALADYVLDTFSVSTDTRPPRIIVESPASGLVTAADFNLTGRVLDNVAGVDSLEVQLDAGVFTPVTFDIAGRFSIPVALPQDGTADGNHVLRLRATDALGNASAPLEFAFTLDTAAPAIAVVAPIEGGVLEAGGLLEGTLSGTGSAVTQFSYAFDGGPAMPIPIDPAGDFSVPLDLSKLGAGNHTLVVSARDAAGNTAATTANVQLAQPIPLSIVAHSPLDGADDVGSTFKPKVVFSRPIDPASLTSTNFFATDAGGSAIPANIVASDDGTFAWLFFNNPMPGGSHITVHVDGSTIRAAGDGQLLDADGDGTPGGTHPYTFTTVSLTPLVGTTLSGKVVDPGPDLDPMTFDDIRAGADGVLHTADDVLLLPIAGVKVFIVGLEDNVVFTDAAGNFFFDAVPAGDVKLAIDGNTATNAPAGFYFPEMVMDLELDASRANTVMGTMGEPEQRAANRDRQEVYLPRLRTTLLHDVSSTQPTMIGVDAESAPNLTSAQRAMLSIEVQPGSLLDQNGNPLSAGQVGISTVPPEMVRDMLPPGLLQHTFDITVQAPGITNFSTPAPMTFPNTFNAPPGSQLNFLSFDHTTGRLVIEGTATVSADGLSVSTDPGQGITHPGWHGLPPPGGPGGPEGQDKGPMVCMLDQQAPQNLALTANNLQIPGIFEFDRSFEIPGEKLSEVEDFLFATNEERGKIVFRNLQPRDPCNPERAELLIEVKVNNSTTNQFLSGLTSQKYLLKPNKEQAIHFAPLAFELMAKNKNLNLRFLDSDRLYGAKVTVEIRRASNKELLPNQPRPFYVYRYVDAGDDISDARLNFLPTLADGADGSKSVRTIKLIGDPEIVDGHLLIGDSTHFPGARNPLDRSIVTIAFDPKSVVEDLDTPLTILTPDPNSRQVGDLRLTGDGRHAYRVFIDSAGLDKLLAELAAGLSPQDIDLQMNPPGMQLPGTFRFTVPGKAPSRVFILDVTKIEKAELEAAFTELLGAGNFSIDVETDTVSVPNRVHLTVVLQNALAQAPQPVIQVEASGANFVSKSAGPRARFGRITPSERELFDTLEKRVPLIQKVVKDIENHFAPFKGIVFTSDPGQATLTIDWETAQSTKIGEITGESIRRQTADLMKAIAGAGLYNLKSQAYRLTKILARPKVASAVVYVDNILESGGAAPFVLNANQFVNALVAAASHEAGHFFGLQHTSFLTAVQIAQEVQTLTVATRGNPGDKFILSFAGEKGDQTLNANSTSGDVLAALLELRTIAASVNHVSVDGPVGGPWTVHFVRPGTPKSALARFSGADVPPIMAEAYPETATIKVVTSEVIDGKSELRVRPKTGRQLGAFNGRNDLMVGGGWPELTGTPDFLPRFSQPALQIGTYNYDHESLVNRDVTEYFDLLRFSMLIPGNPLELSLDPESDELPREFLNLDLGPRLAVLQNDTGVGPEAVEFGEVEVDGAGGQTSVQTLTLLNFGSQDVVVRSVHVAQGYDQFSVAPFPVTTLHPGESLDVEVTFDPVFSGPASGVLSIDSNAEGFVGSFDLVGAGQRTTAELRDELLHNNFGGSAVGQFLPEPRRGALLTNFGVLPVTITAVRTAAGLGDNEFFIGEFPYPVTLQPGESHEVLMQFRPSAAGLRRGVLEVLSDDPQSPIIRKPLVGTGLVEGNLDYGNDFVAVERTFAEIFGNPPVLRTKSDAGGNWEFFLGPETQVHIATFDPVSGLIAHGYATTNPSGQRTVFNIGAFQASAQPDTDGDGLPDDIEFAVGTSVISLDTDGDGISDFAEISQGLNPLDDRPTITGVIAALRLTNPNSSANDITLVADTQDTSRVTAYLANTFGLAIADVTQFDRPLLLSELVLPGSNFDVDVDPQRQLAAVASGQGGLNLINVSDPTRPVLLRTIPINASHVALFDGLAYAAVGNEIQSFDLFSGELVETLSLGDFDILGLRREGTLLFATNTFATESKLHAIDLAGLGMVARGSLNLPRQGADLFVADGVAWIAVYGFFGGLMTVDVSQPDNLRLLSDTDRGTRLVRGIALNGSGLGIVAGAVFSGVPGASLGVAIVVIADDPTRTAPTFTQFVLPQDGLAVALSSGLAYIADGSAGLQVLNFLAFDQGTTPPDVTLAVLDTDLDPGKLGIQMLEASTVTLSARITDDVQVRSVELLVDSVRVSNDVSYPYDLTTTLPTIRQTGNEAVLQVRATDTGGNVRLSDPVVIELFSDLIPPAIVALDPADGSTQAISRRRITVRFSESLDPLAAAASNFELRGPVGVVVPLSVQLRQGNTLIDLYYPPLTEGSYQLVIDAPAVTDRVGNALGAADLVSSFRVASIVREPTIQWINPAGGFWDDPANWDDGRLPGPDDDVLIDMPGDPTITFRQGDVQIRSLVSENPFKITGGRLVVSETIQVNDSFTLRGSVSSNIATLSAVVLRGSGGQGLTIGGFSRLEAATIQTDLTITESGTILRIKNGLALFGTATLGGNIAIGFEGSQQVTSGTFLLPPIAATQSYFGPTFEAIGLATVTFGKDVMVRGGTGFFGQQAFFRQGTLHLINDGKISADVAVATIRTQAESLTNHGVLEAKAGGGLIVNDKTWTNTASGRISASDAQVALGLSNTTSWSNAGTIALTNSIAVFNSGSSGPSEVWSNTGTILVQNSYLALQGQFTSADVENVRQSDNSLKRIDIRGRMDNTGRTFAFTAQTGSYHLTEGGRIVGGTLNMTGPSARLEFASGRGGGGFLDGVTINGDLELGEIVAAGIYHEQVRVVNGLTVNGNVTFHANGTENIMYFEGAPQTVSGAAFRNPVLKSFTGGPVTLDASVTIHSIVLPVFSSDLSFGGVSLFGNFISQAPITVDQGTGVRIVGNLGSPFINRGVVRVNPGNAVTPGGTFSLTSDAINEGTIVADRATLGLGGRGWHNTGVIDATQTQIEFGDNFPLNRIQTSDLGTIRNPGGTITLMNDMVLDNTGSTLVIDSTLGDQWIVSGAHILGGTIQVAPSAHFVAHGGILQDVTVQGDVELGPVYRGGLFLSGEVTIQGTVDATEFGAMLGLGYSRLTPNQPVVIHAGTFNFGGRRPKTIDGLFTSVGDNTFGPDVVLRGRNVTATFVKPLLNQGSIIADLAPEFPGDTDGNAITFTSSPVTNEGLLEAKAGGLLTINNLVTNRGTMKAGAGSVVSVGSSLPQEPAGTVTVEISGQTTSQFGQVTVAGAATLAGTLNVQFIGGFAPSAGDSFQVMTYASESGTFGTVNVTGLPAGLVATPVYNPTNLTIVVGAGLAAAGEPKATASMAPLNPEILPPLIEEAIARWSQAGLAPGIADRLATVPWYVADLPGDTLGLAANDAVWLDRDAAGFGWFIDPTPSDNREFLYDDALRTLRLASPAYADRMDLLTVVEHEIGHLLGRKDTLDPLQAADIMFGLNDPGVRRTLNRSAVDSLLADPRHLAETLRP